MRESASDSRKSVEKVLEFLRKQYSLGHHRLAHKKILFELKAPETNKKVFLWTPESKIYNKGQAWIDFNERQKMEADKYPDKIAIMRLGDGHLVYVDLGKLIEYFTADALMPPTQREGNFWRLYVWHRKPSPYIEIRRVSHHLSIQVDCDTPLKAILS